MECRQTTSRPFVLAGVVGQDDCAPHVDAGVEEYSRGRHPVRLPEEVNSQADGVDPQVHEGAAAQCRIEGRWQLAGR